MMELRNCFIPIVSLYCHNDDDCVMTDNNITDGYWMIGPQPADDNGGVVTANEARDQWPHQVRAWQYYPPFGDDWLSDILLNVTGNTVLESINVPIALNDDNCINSLPNLKSNVRFEQLVQFCI